MKRQHGKVPLVPEQPFVDRVHYCRAFLVIHGLLSDAENRAVKHRISATMQETRKKKT
jgi:hypothetical protein